MTLLFFILVALACIVLGFIVLIQNPKGGGLSGTIAGFNNQFMGVKQTTDVLEKGTWIFSAAIAILCVVSTFFIKGNNVSQSIDNKVIQGINTNVPVPQAPANSTPLQGGDSGK